MRNKTSITYSPGQTKKLGGRIAKLILKNGLKEKAVIIALEGDLGSGKTTFLQGFANGLGIKEKILSPTFVILKKFKITSQNLGISKYHNFYHIDCYRIENPKEILGLGFKEIIANPQNIVAIEWAEKLKKILAKDILRLKFEFEDRNKRRISIYKGEK